MRKKRLLSAVVLGSLTFVTFVCGCAKVKHSKQEIIYDDVMSELVMKKYGIDINVKEVKEVAADKWMDELRYEGVAEIYDTGEKFDVLVSADGKTLYDNYPKLMYMDKILKVLDEIYSDNSKIIVNKSDYLYEMSDEYWMDKSLEEYISESDSYVDIEFSVEGENEKEVAEYISIFLKDIEDRGFKCIAKCEFVTESKSGTLNFASTDTKSLGNIEDIAYKIKMKE